MKRVFLFMVMAVAVVFTSCDSTKNLAKTEQSAQQAFDNGDYATALSQWEEVINAYKQQDAVNKCPVYTDAGVAAYKLGQTDKAIEYLKQADWSEFQKEDTYLTLAKIYRQKDNLSLELVNLEEYLKKFPNGKEREEVQRRLFELYAESDNFEKAVKLWDNNAASYEQDTNMLSLYLQINEKLKNDSVCFGLSEKLLSLDENNTSALAWLSNYYFWKAEKNYQKEMKAYEQHKTRKQYAHLLKELKKVTVDYKKSLEYAKRLYKIEPSAKTASLLAKCYTRLDDKKKAAYYKKLSKQ